MAWAWMPLQPLGRRHSSGVICTRREMELHLYNRLRGAHSPPQVPHIVPIGLPVHILQMASCFACLMPGNHRLPLVSVAGVQSNEEDTRNAKARACPGTGTALQQFPLDLSTSAASRVEAAQGSSIGPWHRPPNGRPSSDRGERAISFASRRHCTAFTILLGELSRDVHINQQSELCQANVAVLGGVSDEEAKSAG